MTQVEENQAKVKAFLDEYMAPYRAVEAKLLPCPFCGGKARVLCQEYGASVDCIECGAMKRVVSPSFGSGLVTELPASITSAWNIRFHDGKIHFPDEGE